MNWDVMNGLAGAGGWALVPLLGFGLVMLVGWLLRRNS